MADISGFDANEVEPNEGFTAIPAGDYQAVIIASGYKATKAGTGRYLELKLQILNGPHQNRQLFDRLNLDNPSETAVRISKGTLSAICRAVNVLTPKDSSELHNKPLTAVVKAKKDDEGNLQNEVQGYKLRHVTAPAAATEVQPAQEQSAEPVAAGQGTSPF